MMMPMSMSVAKVFKKQLLHAKVILKMKVKQKNYVQEILQDVSEALSSSCFCLREERPQINIILGFGVNSLIHI